MYLTDDKGVRQFLFIAYISNSNLYFSGNNVIYILCLWSSLVCF